MMPYSHSTPGVPVSWGRVTPDSGGVGHGICQNPAGTRRGGSVPLFFWGDSPQNGPGWENEVRWVPVLVLAGCGSPAWVPLEVRG